MQATQTDTVNGTVDRLLFKNEENGYTVFVLQINKHTSTVVKGYIPNIHSGEQVSIKGTWVMHPKFGKQLEAQQCTAHVPTSIIGLKKYLSSGLIKGIGPVYAEKLVNHFGEQVLEVIDKEPDRLRNVPGIGAKRVDTIIKAWQDQREISHIMVFLQEKGVSAAYATKIYKRYGNNSVAVLIENPYRLADEIWGIGFKIADKIAQNMGFAHDSVKRVTAGILYALTTFASNGHLYAEMEELKKQTSALLELDEDAISDKRKIALHELHDTEKIKVITHNKKHYIGMTKHYFTEKGIAIKIKNLLEYPSRHVFDLDAIYTAMRVTTNEKEIALNEDQQRSIMAAVQNKVTVITGGPGTGKTTLIKKLLTFLDDKRLTYKLAAPTGRAAKRINEGTSRPAATLHRLLEFDVSVMGFARNEQNTLQLDFLIIDEASMIDVFLGYSLLKAIPLHAHVLFIGDVDQLPSVGAGNFLNDLIASNVASNIKLTNIFRQAQDSLIIQNAHRVNHGDFPSGYIPGTRRDFIFIKEEEPANVPLHLKRIFGITLQRNKIPLSNATVLVPMNRGLVGTQNLNQHLQQLLNPGNQEEQITHGMHTFKVGDRVMQLRNNYDKIVFNGDIGTIDSINTKDRKMVVRYFERLVPYESGDLDELVLSYAISIHKSQGSEYSAAIIPIFMQHFTLLQRNLLYTAITRAKHLCILIGQPKAIAMAVKNNKSVIRTTFLQQFLTTDLTCR